MGARILGAEYFHDSFDKSQVHRLEVWPLSLEESCETPLGYIQGVYLVYSGSEA